ncbi:MAG: LysM peptidoglycan-binding domain-containing protein [Brevefilum sp.]
MTETLVTIPTQTGTLRPYPSDTPSATPFPTGYKTPTSSPTVTPTPTPVYYDVREDDDMYGIAFYYGISPQALMTANPTVNPRAMGPGTTLLIPITPGPEPTATSAMTHTPTPTQPYARLAEPNCYSDTAGGLWCFVLVVNDQESALENISGLVTLASGEDIWQEMAIMPLNLLPGGESLPLIAYFEPPVPEEFVVSAAVDFYLPVMPEDERYLPVEIRERELDFAEDRESVQVSGELELSADEEANYIWLHATALDVDGNVVAVRRWEVDGPIQAGEILTYTLSLYSLGGAIAEVDLLVEAHRQGQPASTPTPSP